MQNSRSRTSTSAKVKTQGLCAITNSSPPIQGMIMNPS
jgi:hypothetical protein